MLGFGSHHCFVGRVPVLFKHLLDCGDEFVGDELVKFLAPEIGWTDRWVESVSEEVDGSQVSCRCYQVLTVDGYLGSFGFEGHDLIWHARAVCGGDAGICC